MRNFTKTKHATCASCTWIFQTHYQLIFIPLYPFIYLRTNEHELSTSRILQSRWKFFYNCLESSVTKIAWTIREVVGRDALTFLWKRILSMKSRSTRKNSRCCYSRHFFAFPTDMKFTNHKLYLFVSKSSHSHEKYCVIKACNLPKMYKSVQSRGNCKLEELLS